MTNKITKRNNRKKTLNQKKNYRQNIKKQIYRRGGSVWDEDIDNFNYNPNFYTVLGLNNYEPSVSKIRSQYTNLIRKYHSDKNVKNSTDDIEIFGEISKYLNKAYSVLSDIEGKKAYDKFLSSNPNIDENNKKFEELKNNNTQTITTQKDTPKNIYINDPELKDFLGKAPNLFSSEPRSSNNGMINPSNNDMVNYSNNGMISPSNNDMVNYSNNGIISPSNNDMVNYSNDGIVSSSNDGMISSSNDDIVSSSNDGMISSSNDGMISSSNDGMISSSNNGMVNSLEQTNNIDNDCNNCLSNITKVCMPVNGVIKQGNTLLLNTTSVNRKRSRNSINNSGLNNSGLNRGLNSGLSGLNSGLSGLKSGLNSGLSGLNSGLNRRYNSGLKGSRKILRKAQAFGNAVNNLPQAVRGEYSDIRTQHKADKYAGLTIQKPSMFSKLKGLFETQKAQGGYKKLKKNKTKKQKNRK